jgi:hypothetical protein
MRIEQDTTKKWWRGQNVSFFGNVAVAKISENGCNQRAKRAMMQSKAKKRKRVETPFCQLFDATLWVPNRCNCEG